MKLRLQAAQSQSEQLRFVKPSAGKGRSPPPLKERTVALTTQEPLINDSSQRGKKQDVWKD